MGGMPKSIEGYSMPVMAAFQIFAHKLNFLIKAGGAGHFLSLPSLSFHSHYDGGNGECPYDFKSLKHLASYLAGFSSGCAFWANSWWRHDE